MLKKEFDILHQSYVNWLFSLKINMLIAGMYGKKVSEEDNTDEYNLLQLVLFVSSANRFRNPSASLIIPAGISDADMGIVISKIKNKIL